MPRWCIRVFVVLAFCAMPSTARADPTQRFVDDRRDQIVILLKEPASPQTDLQIKTIMDGAFDYAEITRRCFGAHWNDLDAAARTHVTTLIRDILRSNLRQSLARLGKNVSQPSVPRGRDLVVRTSATPLDSPGPPIRIDYVVTSARPFQIVDIVAEGDSLTSAFQRDIHRIFTTTGRGYPYLLQKLQQKVARLSVVWVSAGRSQWLQITPSSPSPPPSLQRSP